MSLHEILRDPECKENVQSVIMAACIITIAISLLFSLVILMEWSFNKSELTGNMFKRIAITEDHIVDLKKTIMPSCFKGEKTK